VKPLSFLLFIALSARATAAPPEQRPVPPNRVASVYVSQDFINEQLAQHSKSELIPEMKIALDPEQGRIYLRGRIQVPVEELRAINLDPSIGSFRFQLAIRPDITKKGHLILDFPLDETYFYPSISTDPTHDRVVIPVQMLSLALASARGYLAALSGDFSGFDRRTEKLTSLLKSLDRSIALEKNPDAREYLKTQRASLSLQLSAVPLERKQLQEASKEVEKILGFTGEKELNLNDELAARKNALILKVKLSQLAPYLNGMEFGGARVLLDKKDGGGQSYLALDLSSPMVSTALSTSTAPPAARAGMKAAPSLILRLNQSLLESTAVADAEKAEIGSKIRDLKIDLKEDGLHVSGKWRALFFSVPFDTVVDFVTTGLDVFEVRVRKLDFAGIDLEFMTKFVLEAMKKRLDQTLKGICTFKYIGVETDHSRALQVTVNPRTLVPAFPDLHLVAVDVREQEFLLKVGKPL
jgi:hypothetical protein